MSTSLAISKCFSSAGSLFPFIWKAEDQNVQKVFINGVTESHGNLWWDPSMAANPVWTKPQKQCRFQIYFHSHFHNSSDKYNEYKGRNVRKYEFGDLNKLQSWKIDTQFPITLRRVNYSDKRLVWIGIQSGVSGMLYSASGDFFLNMYCDICALVASRSE